MQKTQPEVLGWTKGEFFSGLHIVAKGVVNILQYGHVGPVRLEVLRRSYKKLRCFSIIFSIASFIVVGVLWLLAAIILWLLSFSISIFNDFHHPWVFQLALNAITLRRALQSVAMIVPPSIVFFLHYWAYQDHDDVFVAALREKQPSVAPTKEKQLEQLADALEVLPPEGVLVWLRHYSASMFTTGCLTIGLLVLSSLPRVGPLVFPVAFLLKRGMNVGLIPGIVLVIVSFVPASPLLPDGRLLSTYGLSIILTGRSTAKQLLYTVLSRGSQGQRRVLSSRHHAYITGFGVAAGAVLSIPIVGSLFWFDMVQLGAHVMRTVVAAEADSVFDLSCAVEKFKLEQLRKKEAMEERARERETRALQRQQERERRLAEQHGFENDKLH